MDHHGALLVGYGTAMLGFVLVRRFAPSCWENVEPPRFARPWVEVGFSLLAVVAVIGVGQLFSSGYLIPETGSGRAIRAAANQVLIFAPILALLAIRRHGPRTAWLPTDRIIARVALGLLLSTLALVAFHLVRGQDVTLGHRLAATWSPDSFDKAVQVFLEDVSIAVLLCRFGAALGRPLLAVVLVGVLFAAAHVPAMLARGTPSQDYAGLVLDAVLAVVVLRVVQRSADIWWFWPVHFVMDMTQFS